ncbi:MAG: BPL-N domain-containing protein [Candidatus Bathyarchaeia archaeon]
MKRKNTVAVAISVFLLSAAVVYFIIPPIMLSNNISNTRCPIQSDTKVVAYDGTGVDWISRGWIAHFLDWWKSYDSAVKYVFLNSTNLNSDCDLSDYPNVRLYVQPGGDASYQQSSLGAAGKVNILNFLDKGGAYLGICAGWYYAAKDYFWEGDFYEFPNLLGRFPTVEGPITEIAVYPAYNMAPMSNGLQMIYYGGPSRGWRQTPHDVPGTVLMTFTGIRGNLPAAVESKNMLLISTHPEAYENFGITGLTTEERIANYQWLANAVNNITGTYFHVPQSTSQDTVGAFEHAPREDSIGGETLRLKSLSSLLVAPTAAAAHSIRLSRRVFLFWKVQSAKVLSVHTIGF